MGPDDNIQGIHTDIRPEEELAMWKANDPVEVFGKKLVADEVLSSEAGGCPENDGCDD